MTGNAEFWQAASYAEAVLLVCATSICLLMSLKSRKQRQGLQQKYEVRLEEEKLRLESIMDLSHDIRTLLNVMMGSQQLLELHLQSNSVPDREKIKRHLEIIRNNGDRLSRLVSWLLEEAKQASGSHHLHLCAHNIVEVVECTAAALQDYAESRGLALYFCSTHKEIKLACDRSKIEAVMFNLLTNAVKYTKAGGSVTVGVLLKPGWAVITVRDTGIGIPSAEQQRVFERYVQLSDQEMPHGVGSGIGLCVVKSMVELHGGSISIVSETGKGSEFIIELPLPGEWHQEKRAV